MIARPLSTLLYRSNPGDAAPRSGALLLVVLLALSLFLAIGVMLMTVSMRARWSARAHGDARLLDSGYELVCKSLLDEALMSAIRGSASGTNPMMVGSVLSSTNVENLLQDKFGNSITCTGSGLSGFNTPVLTLSLNGLPSAESPGQLGGRILTIRPNRPGENHASLRILGAAQNGSSTVCYLANSASPITRTLPSGTFSVVINGKEFAAEAWDAYDDDNIWLAQPILMNGQVDDFNRLSFSGAAGFTSTTTAEVDNDNDGVLDGRWFPLSWTQRSPFGGTLTGSASYLILDLDGRINVNAAGVALTGSSGYATSPSELNTVPIGMGHGPADVDASLLFPATVLSSATSSSGTAASTFAASGTNGFTSFGTPVAIASNSLTGSLKWQAAIPTSQSSVAVTSSTAVITAKWPTLLIAGSTSPVLADTSLPYQLRSPPGLGLIAGRYGVDRSPGASGDDANQQTSGTLPGYFATAAGPNAFADLQGRSRTYIEPPASGEIMPRLVHFTPSLAPDWTDDPYESRLDGMSVSDDAPYSLSELETVLRANDVDVNSLPQRLSAALGDLAQVSRMTITTDSWDSPSVTGTAALILSTALSGTVPWVMSSSGTAAPFPPLAYSGSTSWIFGSGSCNPVSPDIAAGLRFNLNRPVSTAQERHEYCKGLYTLVLLLNGTNGNTSTFRRAAAQWAVNALDFRDADSELTGFEYDDDLSDGWSVDGNIGTSSEPGRQVVWGAERPDVVISEAAAWRDPTNSTSQLFVMLYRPSHLALLKTASSGTAVVTGTTSSTDTALLQGTGLNLDLAKRTPSGSPIWQLRFSPTQVVQFVQNPTGALYSSTAAGVLPVARNSYLCVQPAATQIFSAGTLPSGGSIPTFSVDQGGTFGFGTATSGTVTLQRLANPAAPFDSNINPYVDVDAVVIANIDDKSATPPPTWKKTRRLGPTDAASPDSEASVRFWRNAPLPSTLSGWLTTTGTILGVYPGTNSTNPVYWFHWPNRPFISQAELALVPTGTSGTSASSTNHTLANYSWPIFSLANSATPFGSQVGSPFGLRLADAILDATYVPSRFAGCAATGTGTDINRVGFGILGSRNVPTWREPGKVNLNTIITGTDARTANTDNIVWTTVVSGSNPFAGTPRLRTRPAIPGGPGVPATPARPGQQAVPGAVAKSTSWLLSLNVSGTAPLFQDAGAVSGTAPRGANPFFAYSKAIGLANTTTIHSNVFAVWITVRISDDSPNGPPPVTKRLFAIVDRSIPVGYSPGQDLNVSECIRLKRYLD